MANRYTAHFEVREVLAPILWITGFGGLSLSIKGVVALPDLQGWGELLFGIALITTAVGLWQARDWARWFAGAVSVTYGLWLGFTLFEKPEQHPFGTLAGLVGVCWMAFLAWFSFRPSSRRWFAESREAIARARAAKAR